MKDTRIEKICRTIRLLANIMSTVACALESTYTITLCVCLGFSSFSINGGRIFCWSFQDERKREGGGERTEQNRRGDRERRLGTARDKLKFDKSIVSYSICQSITMPDVTKPITLIASITIIMDT